MNDSITCNIIARLHTEAIKHITLQQWFPITFLEPAKHCTFRTFVRRNLFRSWSLYYRADDTNQVCFIKEICKTCIVGVFRNVMGIHCSSLHYDDCLRIWECLGKFYIDFLVKNLQNFVELILIWYKVYSFLLVADGPFNSLPYFI